MIYCVFVADLILYASFMYIFFLKSGGNGRNRYDTIAALHAAAVDLVHVGPAFLPWHKMLLVLQVFFYDSFFVGF
jgi:hypothetical protein